MRSIQSVIQILTAGIAIPLFIVSTAGASNSLGVGSAKGHKKAYYSKLSQAAVSAENENTLALADTDIKKNIEASEKKRKPATSSALNESLMSPKYRSLRDEFLAVDTPEKLDEMLTNLSSDEYYNSLPTDAKFFAAQIAPAKAFRGFLYKTRQVFERRSRGVHSAVLTTAKYVGTTFTLSLPSEHMKVVYDYIAAPYYEARGQSPALVNQFVDEADIQNWLADDLKGRLYKSIRRLEALKLTEPVVWDQQFAYGKESFKDGMGRFRYVGELEKSLVLSAMYSSVASILVIRSYDIEGSIDLAREIGMLYGIDGFGIGRAVDGVSSQKVTAAIQRFPNIGEMIPNDGAILLPKAYIATKNSMIHLNAAWQASSVERRNEDLYAIDSGYWRVNRADFDQNIEILSRVVLSGRSETMRSSVTGELIEINFANFFNENAPKNLQVFLPKTFESKARIDRKTILAGKTFDISYRNYAQGSPLTWGTSEYQKYIPSVKSDDDVFRSLRVLSHSGGNWLALVK